MKVDAFRSREDDSNLKPRAVLLVGIVQKDSAK